MTSYFQRRKKAKLFKQWVKDAELPPEEIPPDLSGEKSEEKQTEDVTLDSVSKHTTRLAVDKGMVHLPIRYVVLMLSIIAVLLITLSVLVTILLTRS